MERLTYFENGHWRLDFNGCQYRADFVDRLAAYEDTGLTPEEILNVKRLLEERNYALKFHLVLLKEQLRCDERDRDISDWLTGPGDAKFSAGRCEATKEEIGWLERMVRDG
nr:MAG TPA: hypothetical protein [Bacteriophage sp.]